jgi:hypothetical protein
MQLHKASGALKIRPRNVFPRLSDRRFRLEVMAPGHVHLSANTNNERSSLS